MRVVMIIIGLAYLVYAALVLFGMLGAGFPDGHVSPYNRETALPILVLATMLLCEAILLLARAALGHSGRLDLLLALAAALFMVAPIALIEACPHLPVCADTVRQITGMMIDDGAGG